MQFTRMHNFSKMFINFFYDPSLNLPMTFRGFQAISKLHK